MNDITFMDKETEDLFINENNKNPIFRYIPLKNIESNKLWFANPAEWKDPFEKLFINSTYKINNKKQGFIYKNRIYCMCITTTKYNEAAWKVYGSEVQFRISKTNLLEILKRNSNKYNIYIGKVEYRTTTDLKTASPLTLLKLTKEDFKFPKSWIRLLLQKRNDFSYENEIRIILIDKNQESDNLKKGIDIEYNMEFTELFPNVIISPNLNAEEHEKTRQTLLDNFFYSPECIQTNSLYKEVEPRNINLDYKNKRTDLR